MIIKRSLTQKGKNFRKKNSATRRASIKFRQSVVLELSKIDERYYRRKCSYPNLGRNMAQSFSICIKLFNLILQSGKMPDIWCQGLITPIYKSGDKSDPTNYRGISVSSCLGKLFCSILNQSLCLYFKENKIFPNWLST